MSSIILDWALQKADWIIAVGVICLLLRWGVTRQLALNLAKTIMLKMKRKA